MDFALSDRVVELKARLEAFMAEHIYPNERAYAAEVDSGDRWQPTKIMEELKAHAREAGLWNLFLPDSDRGPGLTNLEYAPLCEVMGRSPIAPEAFNCSAPDTGNMELLERYATEVQKKAWLEPLLAGEIRSTFAMTEPGVASSDATNLEARIERDGDHYVVNGLKWWASGAADARCKIFIFMGKSDPDAARHKQHSMVLVPIDTPGVTVIRPLGKGGVCEIRISELVAVSSLMKVPPSSTTASGAKLAPVRLSCSPPGYLPLPGSHYRCAAVHTEFLEPAGSSRL